MSEMKNIAAKVKDVMNAHSCCPELKVVCEEFLQAVGTPKEKAAGKKLIAELELDVMKIDEVIDFFASEEAAKDFGKELADKILDHARTIKAGGAIYCDCPACAPGLEILENKALFA